METRTVKIAIVGGGTAGMGAWRQASRYSDEVALIESGPWGTTCARVGCMPSKLLVAAADSAHHARECGRFGIQTGPVRVDGKAVLERVRRERDRFVGFVLDAVEKIPESARIHGQARFIEPGVLAVDDRLRIQAERIVLAPGSRTSMPDQLKPAGDRLITSDDVFEWPDLPESVAVFGPGVIGLELGQALARLGVRVRMFGRGGAIGSIQDDQIRALALDTFRKDFALDPDATVHTLENTGEAVKISFLDEHENECSERFDYVLAATGRQSNLDKLGLDRSGLALDDRGMPVFDPHSLQCGDKPVFVAGDSNDHRPLLHEAVDEGRMAGINAGCFPEVKSGPRRAPLSVVFTDPQIASAGMSLTELQAQCKDEYAVGSVDFQGQGRSRVMGRNVGLLRVYGHLESGRFLGAEMFGPAAEHLGHLLAWAAQEAMTVSRMLELPYYHPVIEEGLRTALRDLDSRIRREGPADEDCIDCGPGA